jgi:glycosyltransferase involved in cell wall biosynthesis
MRVQRALGSLPIRALAHPERAAEVRFLETKTERVRVAVLGGIGLHKGYRALLDLARHAHAASLPLDIVVFGTTIDSGSLRALPNVTITGRYTRDSLPALVSAYGCTVAVFLSIWPETFSYTLSEALSLGLRPLVFDIGAPAERLRAFGHGRIVPTTASAAELASEILSLARAPMPEVVRGPFTDYPSILRDYYERER